MRVRSNILRLLRNAASDDGAAAVSFILTFPIFVTIVAVIVQLALMVTAKIMVSHAADTAGRAAVTSLAADRPENVRRAACIALSPISPEGQSTSSDAAAIADALVRTGAPVSDSFAGRYAYAEQATQVTWSPDREFLRSEGKPVDVTVTYRFRLTVPFAMRMISDGGNGSVAGVQGHFWSVSATRRVQVAHGREAEIDRGFWSR